MFANHEAWGEHIERYRRDREALFEKMMRYYPEFEGLPPSAWVEDLIVSLCGFRVHDYPLPVGQLGLCDMANRLVLVNSEMWRFAGRNVNLAALRACILAHELGHIRLHRDELEERHISLHGRWDSSQLFDSRYYHRENEANLYAAVFLVPGEQLLRHPVGREIYLTWKEGRTIASSRLSSWVKKLADHFGISSVTMRRSLEARGWLEPYQADQGYRIRLIG